MLSLVDLRTRILAGTLDPAGAVRLSQDAITERDPGIGAIVCLHPTR